jgi:hypothetical protein
MTETSVIDRLAGKRLTGAPRAGTKFGAAARREDSATDDENEGGEAGALASAPGPDATTGGRLRFSTDRSSPFSSGCWTVSVPPAAGSLATVDALAIGSGAGAYALGVGGNVGGGNVAGGESAGGTKVDGSADGWAASSCVMAAALACSCSSRLLAAAAPSVGRRLGGVAAFGATASGLTIGAKGDGSVGGTV